MTFLEAILLGIIEGITEFLPISSTGHLILAATAFGISDSDFLSSFEIAIQLGAILSVVVLYARRLVTDRDTVQKVLVAFLPTAVIGALAYNAIKYYLMGNENVVVLALLFGGVFLIVFELFHVKKTDEQARQISYKQAVVIGLFQAVAMIPGVSRSAATIIGGLLLGVERRTIVEFSFLLAIPTMAAATGLDLSQTATDFSFHQWSVLAVGFVTSFVVALLSVKFLLHFIKAHSFISFGIYRIAIAILFWLSM